MTALYAARFLELKTMRHQSSLEQSANTTHSTYNLITISYNHTFVQNFVKVSNPVALSGSRVI